MAGVPFMQDAPLRVTDMVGGWGRRPATYNILPGLYQVSVFLSTLFIYQSYPALQNILHYYPIGLFLPPSLIYTRFIEPHVSCPVHNAYLRTPKTCLSRPCCLRRCCPLAPLLVKTICGNCQQHWRTKNSCEQLEGQGVPYA